MPFKLIGTLILLVLVTIFAGFNIDNKCDINLIFKGFKDVPIFFSLMVSFVAGVFVTLPFTIGKGRRGAAKAEKTVKTAEEKKAEKQQKKEAKKAEKLQKKNKKEEEGVPVSPEELKKVESTSKLGLY